MFWNARKWQITMHCPLKTRYNARTKGALDKINSAENGYDSMGFMQRGRDLWWMCTHITRFRCVVSADCCLSSLARPLSFCPLRLLLSTKVVRVDPFSFSRRGRDRVVIQIPQPHSIHIEEEEKEGEPSKNAASMHGLVNWATRNTVRPLWLSLQ